MSWPRLLVTYEDTGEQSPREWDLLQNPFEFGITFVLYGIGVGNLVEGEQCPFLL